MAPLDSLPADQRAVLQLVLQRGRTYDDIAKLLSIDRGAVRQRALSALDTLGPETELPADQRADITDYLLGQLPAGAAEQTRDRLADSAPERAWARVIAGELADISKDPLPEIPAAGGRSEATEPTPMPTTGPAATEAEATEAEATGAEATGAKATGPRAIEGAGAAAAGAAAATGPSEPSQSAASRVTRALRGDKAEPAEDGDGTAAGGPAASERAISRRGGAILLGVVAVVVIVVVVILATSGGGSKHPTTAATTPPTTTTPAATTGTTGTATTGTTGTGTTTTPTQVIGQINLTAPTAGTKTTGIAEVLKQGATDGIAIVAQNVPANTKSDAYAVWLYNSPSDAHLLGFVNPGVTSTGRLSTAGPLPSNASHYKTLIVTRETQASPKAPGTIILQGTLTGVS